MQVPPLGPTTILRTMVPFPPILICAAAAVNGEVAVHAQVALFTSMEILSTVKHLYSAILETTTDRSKESCAWVESSPFTASAARIKTDVRAHFFLKIGVDFRDSTLIYQIFMPYPA